MQTRLVQLLTRYLGALLTAVSAWLLGTAPTDAQTGQIENLSGVIATGIVAIVMFLADLLLHRLRERSAKAGG